MPTQELIARGWFLAVLTVSLVYVVVSELRARARRRRGVPAPGVYPGSRREAGDVNLAWWRSLSTEEQAAYDAEVIEATAAAEDTARAAAEHLLERRAVVNAQFHP